MAPAFDALHCKVLHLATYSTRFCVLVPTVPPGCLCLNWLSLGPTTSFDTSNLGCDDTIGMITNERVRPRGVGAAAAKMSPDLQGSTASQAQNSAAAPSPGWNTILPRAAAITTLVVISIWVHQLGGVHAGKDVAADGSISTDRCACSNQQCHTATSCVSV